MKCPSKEIDKNNISLLLLNHDFSIVSLNLNIRFVCFFRCPVVFLQSMAVWCVFVGSCRVAEEHSGLSSEIHACCLLLARSRGCRVSLFLSDAGPWTCIRIADPLLCSSLLQALLYWWGLVQCEQRGRSLDVWSYQSKTIRGWFWLSCLFPAVDTRCRSTRCTTAPQTSLGSALD